MIVSRGTVRFSPDGGRAACRATDHTGAQTLELWRLSPAGPVRTAVVGVSGEPALTQLVVLNDGRALHCGYRPGQQSMCLVHPDGRVETLAGAGGPLRFLPAPAGSGWIATALSPGDGDTLVSAVLAGGVRRPVTRLPGPVGGAAVSGGYLVATVLIAGVPTVLRLDPNGGHGPLLAADDPLARAAAHVLIAGTEHVLLGLAGPDPANRPPDNQPPEYRPAEHRPAEYQRPEHRSAGHRLAVASAATGVVRVVPDSARLSGPAAPAALDPLGRTALLTVTRGVRSELHRIDLVAGTTTPVALPPGMLTAVGGCSPGGWWLPYSAPDRPCTFGWVPPGADTLRPADEPGQAGEWAGARVEHFAGAHAPVEAVIYGPDWRASRGVVLALHGGPDAHWSLDFDPFFQLLVRAGLTVVAPNQRGSSGYGRAHAGAIDGAWGGPDVDDILAIAGTLRAGRDPRAALPVVYGTSYGAFLALLAAAREPRGWSGCAAIAPFRSAVSLYADAGPAVRNLIDRRGGRGGASADLDAVLDRITVPVLLAHGLLDETIPVAQSRALAARLRAAGRRVCLLEAPGRGHAAFRPSPDDPIAAALIDFLGDPTRQEPTALEPVAR